MALSDAPKLRRVSHLCFKFKNGIKSKCPLQKLIFPDNSLTFAHLLGKKYFRCTFLARKYNGMATKILFLHRINDLEIFKWSSKGKISYHLLATVIQLPLLWQQTSFLRFSSLTSQWMRSFKSQVKVCRQWQQSSEIRYDMVITISIIDINVFMASRQIFFNGFNFLKRRSIALDFQSPLCTNSHFKNLRKLKIAAFPLLEKLTR